jgi:acyl-CoA thioester hydrolase
MDGLPRIPVFRRTRRVTERDVDLLRHVNNVVWVRFVVELAEAHATALGLDFQTMQSLGGIWIVRRHDVLYHATVAVGAEIQESTWVTSMRAALSRRHARFENASGRLLVESATDWAYVDVTSLRPRRVSPNVRDRFDLVETPGAPG